MKILQSGRSIAISVSEANRDLIVEVSQSFSAAGLGVTTYLADGNGGMLMERAIAEGAFAGVLDFTLTELAAERQGLPGSAGPDRLTAAAIRGIPQVIVPGGLQAFHDPKLFDALAKEVAEKACAARGPTIILLPARAAGDALGRIFDESLQNWVYGIRIVIAAAQLHEPAFVQQALQLLLEQLAVPSE